MSHLILSVPCLVWSGLGILALVTSGCNGDIATKRELDPATLEMSMPAEFGPLWRPAVEFKHDLHTRALNKEGCGECHPRDSQGQWVFAFMRTDNPADKDELTDLYHEHCIGCHRKRAQSQETTGPVMCGECHVERAAGESKRMAISFDYSLHGRHSIAENNDCSKCHHVYNEQKAKTEYQKGKESACRDCHIAGDQNASTVPNLRTASHVGCINCHKERKRQGRKSGPEDCMGCHDRERQSAIEKLKVIPRIDRGQPDTVWIDTTGAEFNMVSFDHQMHESHSRFCSSCHHQTLEKCGVCHTLNGSEKGEGITLADAYHSDQSDHSCVGCHRRYTASPNCAGCHYSIGDLPKDHSCSICHDRPRRGTAIDLSPPTFERAPQLPKLPSLSDDFPKIVIIDRLAKEYGPSRLPHYRIVARLQKTIQTSALARRFHGTTQLLCAGCHHQTPIGTRPPPCSSCHSRSEAMVVDKPSLKVAYHRQCLGCHREMGLRQGCTDCHALATEEVQR